MSDLKDEFSRYADDIRRDNHIDSGFVAMQQEGKFMIYWLGEGEDNLDVLGAVAGEEVDLYVV